MLLALAYSWLRLLLDLVDVRLRVHDPEVELLLLRYQLRVVRRQVKRPQLNAADRAIMAALSRRVSRVALAGMLVQPETVLGWHRPLIYGAGDEADHLVRRDRPAGCGLGEPASKECQLGAERVRCVGALPDPRSRPQVRRWLGPPLRSPRHCVASDTTLPPRGNLSPRATHRPHPRP